MEIHSSRSCEAAHEAGESALEIAAQEYEIVFMKRCTKLA
jgi:hypothetical protein